MQNERYLLKGTIFEVRNVHGRVVRFTTSDCTRLFPFPNVTMLHVNKSQRGNQQFYLHRAILADIEF